MMDRLVEVVFIQVTKAGVDTFRVLGSLLKVAAMEAEAKTKAGAFQIPIEEACRLVPDLTDVEIARAYMCPPARSDEERLLKMTLRDVSTDKPS